jgi:hypothetical protein
MFILDFRIIQSLRIQLRAQDTFSIMVKIASPENRWLAMTLEY